MKSGLSGLLSSSEIFEQADESLLRRLGEDRRIERKSASYSGSKLGEYLSMWANTSPSGGIIASGILDNGEFEGFHAKSQEQINKLEQVGKTFCPDAIVETRRVEVQNRSGERDFVVLFKVKYHQNIVVKTVSGKAFVRKGDSKYELKPDEIRELQADKGEVSFELRDAPLKYPDGFDSTNIEQFVAKVRKARGLSDELTIEEVLDIRNLGRKENSKFVPNYACGLLFASNPLRLMPGCKIHFQRFEGEQEGTGDRYNAIKDEILEGQVPDLIQQVETLLDSQLRTFSPLDDQGKFFPLSEYPKPAWYEVIVNACVHRSYGNGMKNMPIFVKMFDDRLVVESPGPFPPFVTPENIYEMHNPRNPMLMDAMFYLQYVKCAHEGTRRIRDTMATMHLPAPEFKQSEIGHSIVRVTLRNNVKQRRAWIDQDVTKVVSEAIAAGLSKDEKNVLNWAAEHGRITISDANKLLDMTWHSARRLLINLAKNRILQYIRFKEYTKNIRDSKAYFRLRSLEELPEGAFEQTDLSSEI